MTHQQTLASVLLRAATIALYAVFLLMCYTSAYAEEAPKVTLNDYRTPASPGFVILGIEPASIARPSTARALSLSLLSQTQSYAVEFSPYWLTSHPRLTLTEYQHAKVWTRLWQNLAVTTATTDLGEVVSGSQGTGLGLGVRTQLIDGATRDSAAFEPARQLIAGFQNRMLDADSEEVERLAANLQDSLNAMAALDPAKANAGLNVEIACAVSAGAYHDNPHQARVLRWGAWLTPAYRLARPLLDFIGVGRLLRDELIDETLADLGARLALQAGSFELSGEYLARVVVSHNPDLKNTHRLDALVGYRFGAGPRVFLSVGEDFIKEGSPQRRLIANIGLNLGVGPLSGFHF